MFEDSRTVERRWTNMHLTPAELIDLAEGTRHESSAPHLTACAACQRQLAEARAMLTSVADVSVPEPSPLFWDHLSQRVSEAVAAERPARRSWIGAGWSVGWLAGAVAAVALIVALGSGLMTRREPTQAPPAEAAAAGTPGGAGASVPRELLSELGPDDPSLELVAGLSDGVDGDAELASGGSAEHAVTHLSSAELRELGRLLREELAHSGA